MTVHPLGIGQATGPATCPSVEQWQGIYDPNDPCQSPTTPLPLYSPVAAGTYISPLTGTPVGPAPVGGTGTAGAAGTTEPTGVTPTMYLGLAAALGVLVLAAAMSGK